MRFSLFSPPPAQADVDREVCRLQSAIDAAHRSRSHGRWVLCVSVGITLCGGFAAWSLPFSTTFGVGFLFWAVIFLFAFLHWFDAETRSCSDINLLENSLVDFVPIGEEDILPAASLAEANFFALRYMETIARMGRPMLKIELQVIQRFCESHGCVPSVDGASERHEQVVRLISVGALRAH